MFMLTYMHMPVPQGDGMEVTVVFIRSRSPWIGREFTLLDAGVPSRQEGVDLDDLPPNASCKGLLVKGRPPSLLGVSSTFSQTRISVFS